MFRSLVPFVLGLVAAAVIGSPARAGEVPGTARSDASLVPPELLDTPALVALHPQRSVLVPTQISSLANTDRTIGHVFGLASSDRHAVFGFGQTIRFSGSHSIPVLQAGWALRLGEFRFGAALRGARDRSYQASAQGVFLQEEQEENLSRLRETTVGVGFGTGRTFVDVTAEVTQREGESSESVREGPEIRLASVRGESESRVGGWVRIGFPLGERLSVRVAGGYADRDSEVQLRLLEEVPTETSLSRDDPAGHSWLARLAVSGPLDDGSWIVWTGYESLRGRLGFGASAFSPRVTIASDEVDLWAAGLSMQHAWWWELEATAGLRGSYGRTARNERWTEASGAAPRTNDRVDEEFDHDFGWGLTREFGRVSLSGALSTSLSLSDPFASLDVTFLF